METWLAFISVLQTVPFLIFSAIICIVANGIVSTLQVNHCGIRVKEVQNAADNPCSIQYYIVGWQQFAKLWQRQLKKQQYLCCPRLLAVQPSTWM